MESPQFWENEPGSATAVKYRATHGEVNPISDFETREPPHYASLNL